MFNRCRWAYNGITTSGEILKSESEKIAINIDYFYKACEITWKKLGFVVYELAEVGESRSEGT